MSEYEDLIAAGADMRRPEIRLETHPLAPLEMILVRQPVQEEERPRPLLRDIWPTLSIEERLHIYLEQTTREPPETIHPRFRDALENIQYFVIEGRPLPERDEL